MAFESTISAVDRFVGFGQVEAKEMNYSTFQSSVRNYFLLSIQVGHGTLGSSENTLSGRHVRE